MHHWCVGVEILVVCHSVCFYLLNLFDLLNSVTEWILFYHLEEHRIRYHILRFNVGY